MERTSKKNPKLNRIISYQNNEVIARFCIDYGVPKKEAEIIFKDMLRFLWLSHRAKFFGQRLKSKPRQMAMYLPFIIVDEMWHTFLLYTCEYEIFSKRYFGCFMHHIPEPTLNKSSAERKSKKSGSILETEIQNLIELVWDELGADVAKRWFEIYPKKYSKLKINKNKLRALAA